MQHGLNASFGCSCIAEFDYSLFLIHSRHSIFMAFVALFFNTVFIYMFNFILSALLCVALCICLLNYYRGKGLK